MTVLPGDDHDAIPHGAPVHTSDGKYLGVVVSISRHVLVVERGWLDRRGYVVPAGEIARFEGGVVELSRTLADITHRGNLR